MIGIICAMQEEISEILVFMKNIEKQKYGSFTFIKGDIWSIPCVVTLCGIGKVNAAICTQTLIIRYNPDFVINVGVAGGIVPDINIGDIVIASAVIQHDFDISAFPNRKKGEVPGIDTVEIKTTDWIRNKILVCSQDIGTYQVHNGIILSGDQFICSKQKLVELKNEFNGITCEMEAGSIGQVCYLNKKDFGIIRSISDHADNSSNVDFEKFVCDSSKNAALILRNFIKSYQD